MERCATPPPPPSNKAWCKQSILGKEKILNNMTWVYFRWPRFLLQRTQTNFLLGSLVLVDPNTFWPELTFPWLHGTNAYIEFVPLRLESLTKHVHRFPPPCESKQILTWVHFPSACFLQFYWRSFAQPPDTNIHMGFVSLGLLKLTLITQPCGPKQILTWVHFPSA